MASEGERLAVLETKVNNIEKTTTDTSQKLDRLIEKIDDTFVKHSEIKSLEEEIDQRFKSLNDKLSKVSDAKTTEKWVLRILLTISVIVNIVGVYELFN